MSTEENITKFKKFDQYDFDNDEKFKSGISSLLNGQQNDQELIEKAKLFYYTKCVEAFDFEEYKEWKKQDQEDKPPKFSFQELVDMIEKGIEIPGIKQIPNKINEGTPSESKMTARPKPWETNKEQ